MADRFYNISGGEQKLIELLRTLQPFERVEITADKMGKADTFLVHRSSKLIVSGYEIIAVK